MFHTHTRHATLWLSWGGVGWGCGNNVHVNLHTHVMLRYGYIWLSWGGVGWGNNVHVNLHTHTHTHVMLRYGYLGVGWGGAITFMSTCTHTSCYVMVILGWGGVGWGNNVHVELAAGQQSLGSSALETLKKKIWQQVAGGP